MEETSRYVNSGWEVGLLWKPNVSNFHYIFITSFLHLLEKRLDRDEIYAEKYYKEMDRLFDENFAEIVKAPTTHNKVWLHAAFWGSKTDGQGTLGF